MRTRLVLAALSIAGGGCTTTFYGAPFVEGGRPRCEQVCAAWRMELAGMVRMGEYSDGCVCQVPGKTIAPQAAAATAEAEAAAVATQMDEQRQAAAMSATMH